MSKSVKLPTLILFGLAAAALVAHSLVFNFVTDDAFISFRYARNLIERGELVFNPGERVEGYTNFLWTIILAGAMKLGIQPELSSRLFGTLLAVGIFGLLFRFSCRRLHAGASAWCAVAPLMLAANAGYACWSSGGLEVQLFGFLLTLGFLLYVEEKLEGRPPTWSALPLALAAMTRPDGALIFALMALHHAGWRIVRERRFPWPRPRELGWVALFAVPYGLYFAWRWHYYGYFFPNTYYVKTSATAWGRGVYYLGRAAFDLGFWMAGILAAAALRRGIGRARTQLISLFLVIAVGFGTYIAKVGGDFIGLYRFVVPFLPLLALCMQELLYQLWTKLGPDAAGSRAMDGSGAGEGATAATDAAAGGEPVRAAARRGFRLDDRARLAMVISVLATLAVFGGVISKRSLRTGHDRGIDRIGFLRIYAHDRALIGQWLGRHVRDDDIITVGGAGALPYYARVPTLDVFGLVDVWVAHNAPAYSTRPGHQKFAPDGYLLSRKPTILCHDYSITRDPPRPSPARNLMWRARGFHHVYVRIEGMRGGRYFGFWKRRDRSLGPLGPESP